MQNKNKNLSQKTPHISDLGGNLTRYNGNGGGLAASEASSSLFNSPRKLHK